MTDPLTLHSPTKLLTAFTNTINTDIYPLSAKAVANGSKLFGAAVLLKKDLSVVIADTNQESDSPLWHGETWTISKFFEIPKQQRPNVKDCLFLTTHEPCSLCLSAITWSGFDNFTYMYTYEETHHIFQCHGDLDIFAAVFHRSPSATESEAKVASVDGLQKQIRPEYKLRNEMFVALSFAELVAAVDSGDDNGVSAERQAWAEKVEECKKYYGRLSPDYRKYYGLSE